MRTTICPLVLVSLAVLSLVGCSPTTDITTLQTQLTELTAKVSALEAQSTAQQAQVQYLQDMTAIQKLQAQYVHSLFTQRYESIPGLYAQNNPDVSVEFSDSGLFKGIESVRKLYGAFAKTRNVPGFFILHMAANPYIEIASDGQSAKSHWLSPGASNSPSGSSWIWGPYYVDYTKENGEWKILHSNLNPLFRNPYQYSWGESPHHGTVNVSGLLGIEPDGPSTLYRPFNEVKTEPNMFRNHPELPKPY
jgi:outer membrane murein-binding lipoprotein Lpp